jgi:hypothetical protein
MDTVVVVLQGLFEFIGQRVTWFETEDVDKVYSETRQTAEDLVSDPWGELLKKTREIVEIVEDPRKAVEDVTNETAQEHKETIEGYDIAKQLAPPEKVDEKLVRDLLRDSWLFDGADPEIVRGMIDLIQLIHLVLRGRKLVLRYIQAASDILNLIEYGVKAVKTPQLVLKDLRDDLAERLVELIHKALVHEIEHKFLHLIGSERVGSHSLLSKDDDKALLYDKAILLASFVDAYIVSLMVRAPQPKGGPPPLSPAIAAVTKWEAPSATSRSTWTRTIGRTRCARSRNTSRPTP